MKYKSLIINSDEWKKQFLLGCGCCFWNHWNYDEYEGRSIIRKESEKWLSEKFNNIARMGYKLLDERIKRHDYYEQNVYEGHSYHGVYRFEKNLGTPEEYYVYLGPLLNIDKMGCGSIGCGSIGCNGIGCNGIGCKGIGCKNKPWMGCGCGKKSGSDDQFVNFEENQKNEPKVQNLNKYFNLRNEECCLEDGFLYDNLNCTDVDLDEYVRDNHKFIESCFIEDIKDIEAKGFHFERILNLPSSNNLETKAMLFSKSSTKTISIATQDAIDIINAEGSVYLSDFDLWYYPVVYGFFGWLGHQIVKLLPFLKRKKAGRLYPGDIDEANKLLIEYQYNEDFNKQIDRQKLIDDTRERILSGNMIAMIGIEAYSRKKIFWLVERFYRRLFRGIEYNLDSSASIVFEIHS